MTWSYGADPMEDPIDEVKFLVGDTDSTEPLIQNEEIEFHLALYPKPAGKPAYLAAAATCDAIAAQFARKASRSLARGLSIQAEQQYDHYVAVAQQLRTAYATTGQGIIPSNALRIHPGVPVLGGGGRTILGDANLHSGGLGTPA